MFLKWGVQAVPVTSQGCWCFKFHDSIAIKYYLRYQMKEGEYIKNPEAVRVKEIITVVWKAAHIVTVSWFSVLLQRIYSNKNDKGM